MLFSIIKCLVWVISDLTWAFVLSIQWFLSLKKSYAYEKIAWRDGLGFMITQIFCITSEKRNEGIKILRFFWKIYLFWGGNHKPVQVKFWWITRVHFYYSTKEDIWGKKARKWNRQTSDLIQTLLLLEQICLEAFSLNISL